MTEPGLVDCPRCHGTLVKGFVCALATRGPTTLGWIPADHPELKVDDAAPLSKWSPWTLGLVPSPRFEAQCCSACRLFVFTC